MLCVLRWSEAGPVGTGQQVLASTVLYIAESPKQGSKRGNSITKTIYSTLPILLYYLSMVGSYRDKRAHLHQFMLTVTVNNKVKHM